MGVGGKKEDYDFRRDSDDMEWWAEQRFNIREVRMIYSFLENTARIIISSMHTYRRTGNNCSLSQVAKNSEIVLLEFFFHVKHS